LVRVNVGYPSERAEVAMLHAHGVQPPVPHAVLNADDLLRLQSIAARVHVESDIQEYIVALVQFTRNHSRVVLGASPRAKLSLLRAAKSSAVIQGRAFATPDDVRDVASAVLAHRLILVPELEGDAKARTGVVDEALAKVGYRRAVRPV
jgi:MoxR-like ATPase